MDDFLIAYCNECGEPIATVKLSGFRSGKCNRCAVKHRVKHTTRKCAGCEVVMDLSSLPKHARPRKKYHDHACYGRARTAAYEASTPDVKICAKCGALLLRINYTPTKWRAKTTCHGSKPCTNPPS